jgi:type VI secretion system protein ImpM
MSLGWFGKIPALGDFSVRRLPQSFVEPWDRWLSQELSAAQARLEEAWPVRYRRAPIVCFALSAGFIDERDWHGILVPSFDRVGREFPLTITRSHMNEPQRPPQSWWAAVVAAGQRALEPGSSASDLDIALTAIRDATPSDCVDVAIAANSAWWRWRNEPASAHLSDNLPTGVAFTDLFGL